MMEIAVLHMVSACLMHCCFATQCMEVNGTALFIHDGYEFCRLITIGGTAFTDRFFAYLLDCCRLVRFWLRMRRRRSQNSCGSSRFLACTHGGGQLAASSPLSRRLSYESSR